MKYPVGVESKRIYDVFANRHHHQRGESRMALGVLPFHYEAEKSTSGLTGFAGLAVYLDLIRVSGLPAAVRRHLGAAGRQGWLDVQMIVALLALNLSGGDRVEDLERGGGRRLCRGPARG